MFNSIDFGTFVGYFIITVVIGWIAARREKATVRDYFLAGNSLPWYAMGASVVAAGISSEQFVGEIGYAYKVGMPVANWEWLVVPAFTIMVWVFIPIYFRNRVSTMPEYLERRFGSRTRTVFALLTLGSYVFANFPLVFYTAGFALHRLWGLDQTVSVWLVVGMTGLYTVYGGLMSVAWTNFFQCVLLLGGGLYVFIAGMSAIGWNFPAVLGTGQQAHLIAAADHPDVPWTAVVILALSTNLWYYASNQYINQRCLAARSEWDAKMGILFAGALQLLMPLATCFPGMIYRVINPKLGASDEAYTGIITAVVPPGLRGLIVAAVLAAIMSTIAGLVNSISTITTLDLFKPWKGRDWSDARLVRFGQWTGVAALLFGALIAPVVMRWENLFRYCQDIWAPMAAPIVTVFLGSALWNRADARGAMACLWLAILTIPFTFAKAILGDHGIQFLPVNFQNSLVFAGTVGLVSLVLFVVCSLERNSNLKAPFYTVLASIPVVILGVLSSIGVALTVAAVMLAALLILMFRAHLHRPSQWDWSMLRLPPGEKRPWYQSVGLWWGLLVAAFCLIYYRFW